MRAISTPSVILVISCSIFMAVSALACVDELGVFFDEAGTISVYETNGTETYVRAWVAVIGMSAPDSFMAIEFWLDVDGVGVDSFTSLIGSGQFPAGYGGLFMLAAGSPIPPCDLILIFETWIWMPDPNARREIHVGPIPASPYDSPGYGTSSLVYYHLTPTSGAYDLPVAVINPDAMATVTGAWGDVKRLYR